MRRPLSLRGLQEFRRRERLRPTAWWQFAEEHEPGQSVTAIQAPAGNGVDWQRCRAPDLRDRDLDVCITSRTALE